MFDFNLPASDPTNPNAALVTPAEIAKQRAYAQELMKQGADYSPVRSPWQGVARLAQGLLGGYQAGQADRNEKAGTAAGSKAFSDYISSLGGQSPAANPMGNIDIQPKPSNPGKIYSNDEPSPLDPPSGKDRDLAIRTVYGEDPGKSALGVANVIRNRAIDGGYGGDTPSSVVLAKNQFEPWNDQQAKARMMSLDPNSAEYQRLGQIVDSAYTGANDPTNGAKSFYSPSAQAALGRQTPAWAQNVPTQDIGLHRFVGGAGSDMSAKQGPQVASLGNGPTPDSPPAGNVAVPPQAATDAGANPDPQQQAEKVYSQDEYNPIDQQAPAQAAVQQPVQVAQNAPQQGRVSAADVQKLVTMLPFMSPAHQQIATSLLKSQLEKQMGSDGTWSSAGNGYVLNNKTGEIKKGYEKETDEKDPTSVKEYEYYKKNLGADDKPVSYQDWKAGGGGGMSDVAKETTARQIINGDLSGLKGMTGGGAAKNATLTAIKNKAAEILTGEYGMTPKQAAEHLGTQMQNFHAEGIGKSAEERVRGNREGNLNIILKTAEAAIPAALEASENVARTGWVPINQLVQKGQVIASSPELKRFGMANLQLAEHWARAMNPTGVMRESDRDLALAYLSTADSKDTYRQALDQLHTQILREREAVRRPSTDPAKEATYKQAADELKAKINGGSGGGAGKTLSSDDQQALDWATSNPNDPRAGAIKKRLGQ